MKFILTDYQETATEGVLRALRHATEEFEDDRDYSAVSLSAPTGAGKTVIATAVIERLFNGDEVSPADSEATVLWVTDDPSLNEQTRRKMLVAASGVKPAQLATIDTSFDQKTLDTQRVYFLNIQKLGRNTSYVKGGSDARQYSLWTTLANTVRDRGAHLYVIIDEAHRGARQDAARPSIVSRIISDPESVLPPTPVVWGISATPQRFHAAMDAASTPSRNRREVRVDPAEVRESGLLKDKILIRHPTESQPSDSTLTRLAVDDLRQMTKQWAEYSASEAEPPVVPMIVVQVRTNARDADLSALLATLRDAWPELSGSAIAHSFERHTAINIGVQSVRYVAPQDIQDDPGLRVVLFKEALATGWDCPRAEVMLSFRRAEDYTYIAQLIGRMVRTPLARRIVTNEVLNTVGLFLPYYDEKNVDAVVQRLREDPDAPPTIIEKNPVECRKNPALHENVFDCLLQLPTYVVPGRAHRSQVARLHTLAIRLAGDGIDEQAVSKADAHLIDTLEREKKRLATDGALDARVAKLGTIDYRTRVFHPVGGGDETTTTGKAPADARDINDLLRHAGRGLRDGLAKAYWGHLVGDGAEEDEAKVITAALATDPAIVSAVETAAEGLVQTWLKTHSRAIADLLEVKKSAYHAVRAQARESELVDLALPNTITASGDDPRWEKHVYGDSAGSFPAKFNSWEEEILKIELQPDRHLVAWHRNPTGGDRAVRVPYRDGDYDRPLYPDFVFFHDTEAGLKASIVDPHNYALADAGPKWRGLGAYADKHGDRYARIDAVIKDEAGALLRVDLKDSTVRSALAGANGKEQILQVFRDHGGNYG